MSADERAMSAGEKAMSRGQVATLAIIGLVLCACANKPPPLGKTLADMTPVTVPVEPMPVPKVPLNQIENSYRAALAVAQNPEIRRKILVRLADMEMARSEQRQFDKPALKEHFSEALALYQQLLAASDMDEDRARILYQLSKAYALDGRMEESNQVLDRLVQNYPDSAFAAEADFRRADLAFSSGNYRRAEKLYNHVIGAGQTPFYSNAMYMHGWSLFKQGQYREALTSFAQALRDVLVPGVPIEQLANSRRTLMTDTLRVMAIAFSYLDGVQTIESLAAAMGQPQYQHLLYRQLGDLYLEKKRYRDSANTYLRYIRLFPNSDYAPQLSVRAIKAYQQGNFPSLVRPAKEAFVRNYGINSRYWALRGMLDKEPLLPHLHQFLGELARFYHARAQNSGQEAARQNFLQAANYYQQFVTTFPRDDAAADMTFLMAEAYYEGGALIEALLAYEKVAYEKVAYEYRSAEHGADAGYAAILALEHLIKATSPDTQKTVYNKWREHKIRSAIAFAENYATDKRALPVLASAAEELFAQGELKQAVKVATRLIRWQPAPSAAVQKTAWLVRSHSLFGLQLYNAAEQSYRQTLQRLDAEDKNRSQVIERIAAAMYKQAGQQLAAGNKNGAIERLLQIRKVAPASDIAITAQYDAANYLMDLRQWQRAEQVLVDFRQRYPNNKLAATVAPKLASVYQAIGNWAAAAHELSTMAAKDKDPQVRRQSLYLAAKLYAKAGNTGQAIVHYRRYAHAYPAPFGLATEARFRLVELYEETNKPLKRNYWLKKLIDAHEQARSGAGSTDRARYLAAFAASEVANMQYQAFSRIKLESPLKRNLQRKKTAMEETLASYQRVLDYGVAEFVTEANNRIGMVYSQLSKDLLQSERPPGLNALELAQYEILLQEQAYPFEEKAIDIHAANAKRSWNGIYDKWVKRSFEALAKLLPARYGKQEARQEISHGIY